MKMSKKWIAAGAYTSNFAAGGEADITCNECGVVVRTVPVEQAGAVMAGLASGEICSARCPHCQALNTFPGFSAIEAFICSECGEGVAVDTPVQ